MMLVLHPLNGQTAPKTGNSQSFVTIDFNDVDINVFIKYISELTGRNFVVDRTVKGKVTIISPTQISEEDAYKVFESVLEVHGFTTVPSGSITKIVPAVQARSKSIPTVKQGEYVEPTDKVVTQIIGLDHSDPNEMKKILAPLVSKTSVVIAHAQSGMLIITDVLSNISRLMEIIKVVDVPTVGEELVIIPLKHASVTNVSKSISQLFVRSARKGAKPAMIKIIPYERTNSLIVFATRTQIRKIRDLMEKLDTEAPTGGGKIHVYYLQHANAEELVKVLTSLPSKQSGAKTKAKAPALSNDLKITADPETNALIITAPKEDYLVLEGVIKKLDIPRRMVYLEALIMEVHVTKNFKIGVEWGGASGSFADETGTLVGGFGGSMDAPYSVLQGSQMSPPVLPSGFVLGVLKKGVEIGGVYFPDLGAVLNAYKNDSEINIIATPQILTTDNKKATLVVGENVPYITSKNATDGSTQDYTNYEYKDVGTTLEITPQINQADLLRLEIMVEVTKVKSANDFRPETFKRTATTTVVVHNEETVVIGGMIGQDTSSAEHKVPLLGDLPLLGWLFKSYGEEVVKTNMFIFITPHIVESSAELASVYYDKRDVMESVQEGSSEIPDQFFYNKPNPEHATALADIGFAKLQKKEYAKARDFFKQALAIDPDNPYALINMGIVYEHEGRKNQAAEMYRQVLDLAARDDSDDGVEGAAGQGVDQALQNLARENLKHLQRQ